jgi:DNA polymerase I
MLPPALDEFQSVWFADFEFGGTPGGLQRPRCVVASEWHSARTIRLWLDTPLPPSCPPYSCDRHSLFVAYYASAELACHLALHWPLPVYVLDLYAEFRCLTNGRELQTGNSLLGALLAHGIDGLDAVEKEEMRQLALRGGPWTDAERAALLDYCASDVVALARLLEALRSRLDVPRALLRGQYMKAVARMETAGVPLDTAMLSRLQHAWPWLQERLIQAIDTRYHVYEGRSFRMQRWDAWCRQHGIVWPQHADGTLDLTQQTFKDMAGVYPAVQPMKELRATMAKFRLQALTVGPDGRNRAMLSAFRAKTSRNQPSTNQFIFGPAVWMRHLIRATPGYGLAYIDYEQQEFAIAAVLSGDPAMLAAYQSGDPYLAFAQQAGAVPGGATKASHGAIREQFKACALGVQYGMEAQSLSRRIGQSVAHAAALLNLHRRTYPRFWWWSDSVIDHAVLTQRISTQFGWHLYVGEKPNPRSLRNYPMQSHGAEMLRLACCFATEQGVQVCAPVHDALLIEAPLRDLDAAIAQTEACMRRAGEIVLQGFPLRTEAVRFPSPERYSDPRGTVMWQTVQTLLQTWETAECSSAMEEPATVAG